MTGTTTLPRMKDIMVRDIVSVRAGDDIHEALELMVENRVSALPVVDRRGRCVGILSTSDLIDLTREIEDDLHDVDRLSLVSREWLLARASDSLGNRRVVEMMTESPTTVNPETSLVTAAREMLRHRVHRLPVVDNDGKLLGIVSTMDLLGAFADEAAE